MIRTRPARRQSLMMRVGTLAAFLRSRLLLP